MIKWIKSLWNKLCGAKAEVIEPTLEHCNTHSRFKKSCPECKAAIQ
jgi:hypothetical protein|tara:strand:- start:180 stop:317 length:138 start_codon:yes stop_codon:yes gene_type:complete